jgi:mono/diheme cytochrome c family protein
VVQSRVRPVARRAAILVGVAAAVAAITTGALAGRASSPQPNANLGQTEFTKAGCGACHTFAAARSRGTIGPDLDAPTLTVDQIVQQITQGGYVIMGNAAKKHYPSAMAAFKGRLKSSEILNIAAFVYISRNPYAVGSGASSPATYGNSGSKSSSSSGSGSSGSTSAGSGGSQANNGCAPGVTIQTSGATDNDDDDGGGPTDNDGCI